MENIKRHLQTRDSGTESRGKIDMCYTARTGMGRQRFSNFYKNTTWIFRLEWEC